MLWIICVKRIALSSVVSWLNSLRNCRLMSLIFAMGYVSCLFHCSYLDAMYSENFMPSSASWKLKTCLNFREVCNWDLFTFFLYIYILSIILRHIQQHKKKNQFFSRKIKNHLRHVSESVKQKCVLILLLTSVTVDNFYDIFLPR